MKHTWIALAVAATAWLAQATPGEEPACPNVKASQVRGSVKDAGPKRRCGVGLYLFGYGGAVFGEECPTFRIYTPAHQECQGESAEGLRCSPAGDVPVSRSNCKCGGLVIPILQTGIPTSCECGSESQFGTVEDAKTESC